MIHTAGWVLAGVMQISQCHDGMTGGVGIPKQAALAYRPFVHL